MNIPRLRASQAAGLPSRPPRPTLTRRQLLKTGTAAATLAAGSGLLGPRAAWAASRSPRPIPYGSLFLYPDPTVFHVEAPGYPIGPPFDTNPATNNPATITDFNGFVGVGYVGGFGTRRDLATGQTASLYWEVDLRFMVGEYVGQDGRPHHGTFGFV